LLVAVSLLQYFLCKLTAQIFCYSTGEERLNCFLNGLAARRQWWRDRVVRHFIRYFRLVICICGYLWPGFKVFCSPILRWSSLSVCRNNVYQSRVAKPEQVN